MELSYGVMEDDSWLKKKRYYHGRNSTVVIL